MNPEQEFNYRQPKDVPPVLGAEEMLDSDSHPLNGPSSETGSAQTPAQSNQDSATEIATHRLNQESLRAMSDRFALLGKTTGAIFDRHVTATFRYSTAVDGDDVKQNAWLRWLTISTEHIPPDELKLHNEKLSTMVAHRTRLDANRRHARRHDTPILDELDENGHLTRGFRDPAPGPEDLIVDNTSHSATENIVRAAFEQLPSAQQDVLALIMEDPDMSNADIGERLGLLPSATRVARARALAMLTDRLDAICDDMHASDVNAQYIKRLTTQKKQEKAEKDAKRNAVEYQGPAITPEDQRQRLVIALSHARAKNASVATLQVPHYIGIWGIAALDIASFIHTRQDQDTHIGIVYPHEHLLQQFRAHMAHVIGNKIFAFLHIDTPHNIARVATERAFDYLVGPGMTLQANQPLYDKSGFQLHLYNAAELLPTDQNTFTSPLYSKMGLRKVIWSPEESVHYVLEHQFTTGGIMSRSMLRDLSKSGQGPSDTLVLKGFKNWSALLAATDNSIPHKR